MVLVNLGGSFDCLVVVPLFFLSLQLVTLWTTAPTLSCLLPLCSPSCSPAAQGSWPGPTCQVKAQFDYLQVMHTTSSSIISNRSSVYTCHCSVNHCVCCTNTKHTLMFVLPPRVSEGELRTPSVSIPKGTIAAVFYTFTVYVLLFILVSATCDRYEMLHNSV